MKKRSAKKEMKFRRLFNKMGMTYVELICALALLSLIVVMFTPMLLSSYETLYKAGERVEDVYESKETIEEGLATRYTDVSVVFDSYSLKTNSDILFQTLKINGKKVISNVKAGLETLFSGSRASVDIVSSKVVNDDQDNHDVMIQTSGLEYSKVLFGSYTAKYGTNQEEADKKFVAENEAEANTAEGKGIIFIEVMIPDKKVSSEGGTTDEASTYVSKNVAGILPYKIGNLEETNGSVKWSGSFNMLNTQNEGRIKFNISKSQNGDPLDFTQSPIKIKVYYVNARGRVKEVADYLTIDPPTMIFAGETSSEADYYTSAGVTEKNGVYSLEVQPRKMRVTNSGFLNTADTPSSKKVKIQTITWVQEDENSKLEPYYVMAGTNSSVYRMYNFKKPTTIKEVFGIPAGTSTTDGSLILTDGSIANPSFWSGEMSDQYYFKTLEHSAGYGAGEYVGSDGTQAQEDNHGYDRQHYGSRYDYFDKTLRYSMSFNGFTTGYDYQHLANRRISYVLTEVGGGRSFRLGGKLRKSKEFSDYSMPWEPSGSYYLDEGNTVLWEKWNIFSGRVIAGKDKGKPYEGPVYFQGDGSGGANKHYDNNFAYIRLKSYVSVDPIASSKAKDENYVHRFNKGDFWWPTGDNVEEDEKDQYPNENYNWLAQNTANCVNVTSSAYIPGSGSAGQGQVIYFGTVPAYAFIAQTSDIGTNEEPHAQHVYNGKNVVDGRITGYVVSGSKDAGTTIYRYFNKNNNNIDAVSDYLLDLFNNCFSNIDSKLREENNRTTFYTYNGADTALYYTDSDLEFTFGYCSRWRMAIGDVTYNGKNEVPRSYEKYYIECTEGVASYKTQKVTPKSKYEINQLGEDNLYYNVWFPGEYYNLIQTATLDEVTVAVGYAVSGSSFMKESGAWNSYSNWGANKVGSNEHGNGAFYGTALGSIYNDAVMAAYVSEDAGGRVYKDGVDGIELTGKGEQNVIFQNVLYYKMHQFIDTHNDTTGDDGNCAGWLHTRDSVRFTAVDLVGYTTKADDKGVSSKLYIAVYGDSNGKAYYSVIATSTVTNTTGKEEDAVESNVQLRSGTNPISYNEMYEIEVDGLTMVDDDNIPDNDSRIALDEIFTEITNIDAYEDIVVITGIAKEGQKEQFVVLERYDQETNAWKGKRIYNGNFYSNVNNSMILGGYYYIVGGEPGDEGWIGAISLDALINTPHNGTIKTSDYNSSTSDTNELVWVPTKTDLFALGGRISEG